MIKHKMKLIFFSLFAIMVISEAKSYSNNKWKYDIEYLRDTLPKKHINLFFKITQKDWNNYLDSLELKSNYLSDDFVLLSIKELLSKVGDSHTTIYWKAKIEDKRSLPLEFNWYNDGIYVTATEKQNLSIIGCKIVSINNYSIEEVIKKFRNLIVQDNEASIKQELPNLLKLPVVYDYFGLLPNHDSMIIGVLNKNGSINKVIINNNHKSLSSIKLKRKPLYLKNINKEFWYSGLLKDSILYIQYNKCTGKEYYKFYKKNNQIKFPFGIYLQFKILTSQSFNKFANKIYQELRTNNYNKVVIDFRFNDGGSSSQGTYLIDSISKYKNLMKFGIIGRNTFSSAIINVLDMQIGNAILIGENTSGMAKHFGEVKILYLPQNNVIIQYSTSFFNLTDKYTNSIIPDVSCDLSFDDYLLGNDPCLEYIINKK